MKSVYTYNSVSWITSITYYNKKGKITGDSSYEYDNAGNRTKIVRDKKRPVNGRIAGLADGTSCYQYDPLNQLISETGKKGTIKYFYDTLGNRIRDERYAGRKVFTGASDYVYNQENQLTGIQGKTAGICGMIADRPVSLEYDGRGNLIKVSRAGRMTASYTYDETNRMVSARDVYGMNTQYGYDGNGARISKTVSLDKKNQSVSQAAQTRDSGLDISLKNRCRELFPKSVYKQETVYVTDAVSKSDRILMSWDETGQACRYTYGVDVISMDRIREPGKGSRCGLWAPQRDKDTERLYYRQDEMGSIAGILSENGAVKAEYAYDSFGQPLSKGIGSLMVPENPYRYAGYSYDSSTGLYYVQARYYSPETGRFQSEDKEAGVLSQPAAWNAYTYCLNNPLKYIDAYGYTAKDILIGVGMALDDNLNRGFVKWATGKLFKRVIRENYEDAYDYYMGRVIGDAIALLASVGGIKMGIMKIVGSIITGAGVTVSSMGVMTIGGLEVCVSGVAAGTVEICYAGAVVTSAACNMENDIRKMQEAKEGSGNGKKPTSQNQMQNQVEKGQAPKEVDRVDKPHVDGQQPHVHFKDGTSLNQDGTVHDVHRGTPNVSNKVKKWLINNGWKVNN